MRIEKNTKVIEGVALVQISPNSATQSLIATLYMTEAEALAAEQKAIDAGWCKTEVGWMRKEDAEMCLQYEKQMQEHKKIIAEV